MSLHEYLGEKISDIKIQIFATDLSSIAITRARAGVYSIKEISGISDSRLQLFFNRIDGHYQIKKSIRDMFVFSTHNFLKDPPFGNLDLISCRNVLIYLEPFLQKKAFNTFHYGLREKGILVLGKSETIGNNADLFTPVKKNYNIFIKKNAPGGLINRSYER
jgi:two-component system CheB/CheR fusion protein